MAKSAKLTGRWFIRLYSGEELKEEVSGKNVITDNGLEFLASFLSSAVAGASTFDMDHIAIGTDSTAEASTDTSLGIETARNTATVSYVSNAIYRATATFTSGQGTGAIVEYGLFSSGTGGTMLSRDTEAVINKGANDTLEVTTEITLS